MHILGDFIEFLVSLLHVGKCLQSARLQLSNRADLVWAQLVLGWILLDGAAPFVEVDRCSINVAGDMFREELFPLFVEPVVRLVVEDRSEPVLVARGL